MNVYAPHFPRRLRMVVLLFFLAIGSATYGSAPNGSTALADSSRYQNPLPVHTAEGMLVESCADPSVIQASDASDGAWYMYCTTDPLSNTDRSGTGELIFHLIPIFKSSDLVNWTYAGDAFAARPSWVASDAGLWAPEIEFFNNQYYLYYTASNTTLPGGGSAIGVATSSSPLGPWTDSGTPAVEPHAPPCCPNDRRWTFDPALITDDAGDRYIYYGSYFGGISARKLSADGLLSDPATQVQITIANRYEGGYVVKHEDFYYLFVSATDCCRGPLTGYSVFAGRSKNPLGPFVDREGVSLLAGRVGGTPVLSMNGNRWVGPGHNTVITDLAGQDWFFYHAIDRNDPYFAGEIGFTKRPVLLDALDWIDGWPTVRAGHWASDTPQQKPVTQPDDKPRAPEEALQPQQPGNLVAKLSTEFDGATLPAPWNWVRPPAESEYGLENGTLRFATQAADLHEESNNASVLREPAPPHDYLVETRVKLDLPPEGCCHNYVQAGLVIYGDDDRYIKLVHVSIWETRQTEFAKEVVAEIPGFPRYGNTVVGAPDEWTYLRIARRVCGEEQCYTAYTSRDGVNWVRGGAWTHDLHPQASIGLVAMGGTGFTANFDYVRVYRLDSPGKP
jgi:arabinan endo-1,5-alpha-L-arabinosidase